MKGAKTEELKSMLRQKDLKLEIKHSESDIKDRESGLVRLRFLQALQEAGCDITAGVTNNGIEVSKILETSDTPMERKANEIMTVYINKTRVYA